MVVKIEGLTKYYGKFKALDNFSLEVKEGEILGLLGPNGSGKTTTINCLLSLLTYDSGVIKIFDKQMSVNAYDIKRDIGFVMQNVAVFDELTVIQNIDYFCGLYIKEKSKRKKLVKEAINFVGLQDCIKKFPKQLSGGLLRRLNIACGIAHKPKLVILDEPTVAVDPQSRNYILENIVRLNKEGATVIYTTHYMEEVEKICDRIVIMDSGKEIANGTSEELKRMSEVRERILFDVASLNAEDVNYIENVKGVDKVLYTNNILEIELSDVNASLIDVLNCLNENGIVYEKVRTIPPTLNDVFLELTGKALRD